MKVIGHALALFALTLLVPAMANAQETDESLLVDADNPGVVYKKNTEYDFEDDVVEGSFVRPEGEFFGSKKKNRYRSLIKIRETFLPEMLKSAEDI